jgi:hypothetical protein
MTGASRARPAERAGHLLDGRGAERWASCSTTGQARADRGRPEAGHLLDGRAGHWTDPRCRGRGRVEPIADTYWMGPLSGWRRARPGHRRPASALRLGAVNPDPFARGQPGGGQARGARTLFGRIDSLLDMRRERWRTSCEVDGPRGSPEPGQLLDARASTGAAAARAGPGPGKCASFRAVNPDPFARGRALGVCVRQGAS